MFRRLSAARTVTQRIGLTSRTRLPKRRTPRPSRLRERRDDLRRVVARTPSAGESWDNFRDRFAEGLRIVATYDTHAALVVCDELPDGWSTPFVVDGVSNVARAAVLENEVPLA